MRPSPTWSTPFKYRVIEQLDAPMNERFLVQYAFRSCGLIWITSGKAFPDQLSAEIEMERLAAGPKVVATLG